MNVGHVAAAALVANVVLAPRAVFAADIGNDPATNEITHIQTNHSNTAPMSVADLSVHDWQELIQGTLSVATIVCDCVAEEPATATTAQWGCHAIPHSYPNTLTPFTKLVVSMTNEEITTNGGGLVPTAIDGWGWEGYGPCHGCDDHGQGGVRLNVFAGAHIKVTFRGPNVDPRRPETYQVTDHSLSNCPHSDNDNETFQTVACMLPCRVGEPFKEEDRTCLLALERCGQPCQCWLSLDWRDILSPNPVICHLPGGNLSLAEKEDEP